MSALQVVGWSGRHPVFFIPERAMSDENPSQFGGCLARLFWLMVGNLILVLAAIGIAQNPSGFAPTGRDAIFWAAALALVAVRYVDIRYLYGKTADNRPASLSDWRRYAAAVLGISLAMWIAAHAISLFS
jgi:hypothetical protein